MDTAFDCQRCGACCASFRVSFYWAEADGAHGPGTFGVPADLTEPVNPHLVCMQGTHARQPRCTALQGQVGSTVGCAIYMQRPSPCREVMPGDAQCLKARARHRLSLQVAPPNP